MSEITPAMSLPVSSPPTATELQIAKTSKLARRRSFILHYRYAKIPVLSKVFEFEGDLRAAIQRGREHCTKMGYIFLLVLPFLVDLDDQEARKTQDPDNYEEEDRLRRIL